ncbi:hypothetical protein [Paracoccus sp. KR1-242]|uniref:hypothetical protein n=1 Tax=Paracoccus sp. KR1-242 TaxID=3410028 RepID=UPI003BFF2BEE
MKRRDLMKLAPLALAVGTTPVIAAVKEETPVMRLFREWRAWDDFANAQEDDKDFENALEGRWEVEQRLMQTPSESARDVLIKVNAWTNFGDGDVEGCDPRLSMFWAEARSLIGGAA